jgi:hypothetical protein
VSEEWAREHHRTWVEPERLDETRPKPEQTATTLLSE